MTNLTLPRRQRTRKRTRKATLRCIAAPATRSGTRRTCSFTAWNSSCTAIPLLGVTDFLEFCASSNISQKTTSAGLWS